MAFPPRQGPADRVQAMDQHTAETLLAATSNVMAMIPEMDRFARHFDMNMHHACTDKHSANMKCERLRKQASHPPKTTLHLSCAVHKLYSATACCMKCADRDVTGVLNLGLVHQASPGAYNSLFVNLAIIFRDRLQVTYDEEPERARPFREAVSGEALDAGPAVSGTAENVECCLQMRLLGGRDISR